MRIVTYEDIKSLHISPKLCYQWVDEALMLKNTGNVILPAKIHMVPDDESFCNVMPSLVQLDTGHFGGVKVVTRYPKRVPSLDSQIFLFQADSGKQLAVLDGNWITAMRTGAVAAHSILLFAKSGFRTVGIIGLGNVSRAALLVLAEVVPQQNLHVKLLRYKGQEDSFAERFASYSHLQFSFADSYEDLVRGSDVVVSGVTYFKDDICPDVVFGEGVLLVPIHTRGFTNCDLFFDKIFADDRDHVKGFKNFSKFNSFAEISDVLSGKSVGRESNTERIIAYNIGISLHDIVFASRIYQMIEERCLSTRNLDLKAPKDKFYI